MSRSRLVALAVVALLLAGCTDADEPESSSSASVRAFVPVPPGAVTRQTTSTGLVVFNLDVALAVDGPVTVHDLRARDVRRAKVELIQLARWEEGTEEPSGIVERWPYPQLVPVAPDDDGQVVLTTGAPGRLVVSVGLRADEPERNGFVGNIEFDYSVGDEEGTWVLPYLFGVCRPGTTEAACT